MVLALVRSLFGDNKNLWFKMLLDDSIELDCNDSSASAEPLSVNWDIDLTKIWIPSGVLPNRKKQINPNENKPFVLYTLQKPDYSQTFSVYSDEYPQYHESQASSAVPSEISHQKLTNDNNNKLEVKQVLPSSQSTNEWDARLVIVSENVIPHEHPLNNSKPNDSLQSSQITCNSIFEDATQCEKKTSDTYSILETSYKASLEDLTRRMAEILSEDEPLKENWHHEDVIKTNPVLTGSTLDSIPPSTKDSLEELYYSDEDDNQFAVEYELDNLELESPEKKPTCSIYTENSYVQELRSESFVNDMEQAEKDNDKPVLESSEEKEKIQLENQKVAVDNVFSQNELNRMELVDHNQDFNKELLNYEVESEDPIEIVPELPVAYKRPPLQEQTNKTKPQKEKKKTKKAKINIPLEDLFQHEEVDRFKVPEVDEFYENLVRQGKCKSHNQEINIHGFPSASFTEELYSNVDVRSSINFPDQSQNLFCDSVQKFRQSLIDEPQSNSLNETIRNEEKAGPELKSEDSINTLVIDNIPLNVSKENIESFILGYGELKKLTIERHGKFQRAKLQMDFMCEVDWIIDCLNDSQPFGSFDKELIKCYRQT